MLLGLLTLVFQTAADKRCAAFYKIVPALLLCYFLPSLLTTLGIVSPGWIEFGSALAALREAGHDVAGIETIYQLKVLVADNNLEQLVRPFIHKSQLYFVASRYLLPASLVLLTLSIDLREVLRLGPKALIMFGTATVGVILGGPIALLLVGFIAPSVIQVDSGEEVWRGMTTIAGSWIGGGANQAAMYEIFKEPVTAGGPSLISAKMYAIMITIDVIVAEIWMMFLLLGVGRHQSIDRAFNADASAVSTLQRKMQEFSDRVARIASFKDLMLILGVAFAAVALSHAVADTFAPWISENAPWLGQFSLTSGFFWMIVTATTAGVALSFSPARNLEGVGASKVGSVFIYILVATIGMKMNVLEIFDNPGLFLVGLIWMSIHVVLLLVVAWLIRSPFFFVAVGSKANIGGAASAPVVAAAFHPSLAPVGVLLAVLGYALGTYGAFVCGLLMQAVHGATS